MLVVFTSSIMAVGIDDRDGGEILVEEQFDDAGQRVVRPGPHENGGCCLLYRDAVVLCSEGRDLGIETMVKQLGDKIRSRLLSPAAHLVAPVRFKRRDLDVRPEPVRAKPRFLVLSRQKRHDDVADER